MAVAVGCERDETVAPKKSGEEKRVGFADPGGLQCRACFRHWEISTGFLEEVGFQWNLTEVAVDALWVLEEEVGWSQDTWLLVVAVQTLGLSCLSGDFSLQRCQTVLLEQPLPGELMCYNPRIKPKRRSCFQLGLDCS